ncbi:hypothetical protein AB0C51_06425 [Streptomyces pathocidini]|uniref:Secreted protein n=1 Tax=Streptomyces pathocidini TaxID=1650571 RepID=A0ABW7UX60_9ACTN
MPRPTAAQLVYGSATVVFSTLAMLLLSQTDSGAAVTVIACAALALGLLVAHTVPVPQRTARTRRAGSAAEPASARRDARVPLQRAHASVAKTSS